MTDSYIRQAVEQAREQQPRLVSYDDILESVCGVYGVSMKQLSSPSRRRDLAEARTVALILVREQRRLTLVGLSRLLKRDVSSLSHCLRRLNERLAYDQGLKARIREARQAVAEAHGDAKP
ncbi:MAG: helix-turn-helix domain-containing protein [Acidobacteriota bacterium]